MVAGDRSNDVGAVSYVILFNDGNRRPFFPVMQGDGIIPCKALFSGRMKLVERRPVTNVRSY